MDESVEFVLQMKKFEENANNHWQKLRNEDCFSDVTLACVDQQVKAHRVVLSASSLVLENILKHNPHHNPLIYLGGVKYSDLVSLLDFIYLGEVAIKNEQLYDFLEIAKELKIKGLTDETVFDMERIPPRKRKCETSESSQDKLENLPSNYIEDDSIDSPVDELKLMQNNGKTTVKIANESENISSNIIDANDKEDNIKCGSTTNLNTYEYELENSNIKNVHNIDMAVSENNEHNISETSGISDEEINVKTNEFGESKSPPNYTNYTTNSDVKSILNSADKKVNAHNIKKESNFEETENYDKNTSSLSSQKKICKLCSFKTDDASDLDLHRQTIHQDRFFCEQCSDFSAKTKGHLKHHVLSIHMGNFYTCDKCDYKSSEKNKVNRHKKAVHGEATMLYFCDKCDYSAAVPNTLKKHKLSIHEGRKRAAYRCSVRYCTYVTEIESRLEEHKASRHDKL